MIPVLLMVRELGLGGSERQLTEIAKSLDRSRFQPHVACFHSEGIRGQELKAAGIPVVRFPVRSFYRPSIWAAARRFGDYLQRQQIQLVHTFDVPMNLFGIPAARAWRAPVVISSQRGYRHLTPGLRHHLLRITDLLADAIVVNCQAMRRHLMEEEKIPAGRVRLCYNGIDTQKFHPHRCPVSALTIGTVSALRPEKSLPTLLEAFARIRTLHPDLNLLIVGSGPCLSELEARSQALDLRPHVHFEPATDLVPDWLRKIDIFVLPSRSEALSNSLMEAMACGCAVIASNVGGNPELVQGKQTGLLFEAGNLEQLAAALRLLIEQPWLRQQLAANASRFIRENFSIRTAADCMAAIYEELIAAKTQ